MFNSFGDCSDVVYVLSFVCVLPLTAATTPGPTSTSTITTSATEDSGRLCAEWIQCNTRNTFYGSRYLSRGCALFCNRSFFNI